MTQIDSALEYLHYLGRGGKYSVLKYDDVFKSIQNCANRKGFTNETLLELMKLWLKIKIPLTKWSSLGYCLIPESRVSDDVIHTVMKWILGNYMVESNYFKVVAALNWLIGLFDFSLLNSDVLYLYYEFYFSFLHNDKYVIPSAKLIYNLTKSQDVKRCKVNSIIKLIDKKRSSRHHNCLVAVLNLFKSYKPECVPEEVPNVSINVAFLKTNKLFAEKFEQAQIRSNTRLNLSNTNRLVWWTSEGKVYFQLSSPEVVMLAIALLRGVVWFAPTQERVRKKVWDDNYHLWQKRELSRFAKNHFSKKKQAHLVPDLEYIQLGALIYTDSGKRRKCFDFTSVQDVLVFHYGQAVEIPANMLSLLVNDAGLHVLHFSDAQNQARFSYVLYHTLHSNYLNSNPSLSYNERRHFLQQINKLQARLMQGIPVVSRFLSQYIATWNGIDFLDEVLELLEWVIFESYDELYDCVLEHIECLYLTSDTMYRCSLLEMLLRMYANIHNTLTTKRKLLFLSRRDDLDPADALNNLTTFIDELCNKTTRTSPDNLVMKHFFLNFYESLARIQLKSELPLWSVLPASLVYNILCSFNPFSINRLLGIILSYTSLYEKVKTACGKGPIKTQIAIVEKYTADIVDCLWYSKCVSWSREKLMLNDLPKPMQKYLEKNPEEYDKYLDVGNHFAFVAVQPHQFSEQYDNDFIMKASIMPYFHNIGKFVYTVVEKRKSSSQE